MYQQKVKQKFIFTLHLLAWARTLSRGTLEFELERLQRSPEQYNTMPCSSEHSDYDSCEENKQQRTFL